MVTVDCIRGLGEEGKQKLCDSLNMDRLFPLKSDFRQACSCGECASKMIKLLDFEAEIIFLKSLILDHIFEINDQEELCVSLQSASIWTKQMMNLLHKKFKAVVSEDVYQQQRKSDSTSKLEDVHRQLDQLLIDGGVISQPEKNVYEDENCTRYYYDEQDDVLHVIDTGRFYYGETEAKAKADLVLQKIADIETLHQDDKKKFAEEHKTALPHSTSMNYIQQQIELVKTLPVDDLKLKAKKVTDKMCPDRKLKLVEAKNYICNTLNEMIVKRMYFWGKHRQIRLKKHSLNDLDQALNQDQIMAQEHNSNDVDQTLDSKIDKIMVQEHNSNNVDQTLDSLIDKIETFRKGWEKEFAGLFTSYDRSDPKRQRTE